MRSGKAFYNKALGASLVKRCWPVWGIWFVILLFLLPLELAGFAPEGAQYVVVNAGRRILGCAVDMLRLSVFAAPVVVLLLFSFLYNSRSAGMIAALPVSRGTVFSTVYLTGLVPLLLAELLTALITLSVSSGMTDGSYVWTWLGVSALGITAFYGFAVFCAMLTGSTVILPLVYFALNLAAYLLRELVSATLRDLIYGYRYARCEWIEKLSPPVALEYISVTEPETGRFALSGTPLLCAYCAAGLLLSVAALLLFRKRRMESAGDAVAIPMLKPVFRVCAALAAAFAFASLMYSELLCRVLNGRTAGGAMIVCLGIGALLGWFAAEMLLQKNVRVFSRWKGAVIIAALIAAFGICCETDAFGFEKYCPQPDEIECVSLGYYGTTDFREPDNIAKALNLHQQLIDDKALNEHCGAQRQSLLLSYELKSGKRVERSYEIVCSLDENEPTPAALLLQELINTPEAIDSRAALPEGVTMDDLEQAMLSGSCRIADEYCIQQTELTRRQAEDFLQNCVLPDTADGKMLRVWVVPDEEYYKNVSTLEFDMVFETAKGRIWKEYKIYLDAPRCTKWIEENTDLALQSLAEADMEK